MEYSISDSTSDALLPRNENGRPFLSQSFDFDGLDNITSIVTAFPNSDVNTAKFTYDTTHKQRLIEVSNTLTTGDNAYPPSITLQYDADGNLTSYKDYKMSYSVSGRLSEKNETVYTYDPFDKLVQSNETVHLYSGHRVIQEISGNNTTDLIRCGDIPIGEVRNGQVKIYGVDQKLSVVSVTDDMSTTNTIYSPYGSGDNGARIGMNGAMRDITDSSMYQLGNGTRSYIPGLCGFSSADTFAPFLGGGINPFKYCGNDPINAMDPSGHISILAILGIFVAIVALIAVPFTGGSSAGIAIGVFSGVCGVVSAGLNIGAEVAADHGNTKLASRLGKASLAFGVIGAVAAIGQVAADSISIYKAASAARKLTRGSSSAELLSGFTEDETNLTTGYQRRFTIARKPQLHPEDNLFVQLKGTPGNIATKTFARVSERKFGKLFFRSVKTPIRVLRDGQYAGAVNILSKSQALSRIVSIALLGVPILTIARYADEWSDIFKKEDELDSYATSKYDDYNEVAGQGLDSAVNIAVHTSYGLPVAKRPMKVDTNVFKYF